jgi:hypothetical protein
MPFDVVGVDDVVVADLEVAELAGDVLVLVTMERPVTTTLRPTATAASQTCCRRWMWLEKLATMTLPWAFLMMWRRATPTAASEGVKPGPSRWWSRS